MYGVPQLDYEIILTGLFSVDGILVLCIHEPSIQGHHFFLQFVYTVGPYKTLLALEGVGGMFYGCL